MSELRNIFISFFHSQIGAGAFGVVHRAVAVGIREGEDQVVFFTIDCIIVMIVVHIDCIVNTIVLYCCNDCSYSLVVMIAASKWILSDDGGRQVREATCRKRSAEG